MSKKAPIKIYKSLTGALVCFEKCIVIQQVHKLYTEATVPNFRLLFACQLLILEHRQIYIKPLVDISGEELLHCGKVMIHMIFIKSIVVGKTVCELPAFISSRFTSRRPVRPLPSMKGWIPSNSIWKRASLVTICSVLFA